MLTLAALLALLGACEERATVGETPPGGAGNEAWTDLRLGTATNQVDLLFMVDNSPSMAPKQALLRRDLPQLTSVLNQFAMNGHPGHYHLGVVTSDLGAGMFNIGNGQCHPGGDGGRLVAVGAAADPSCIAPTGAPYVDWDQTAGTSNITMPSIEDQLACMTQVGDKGCGFEMQLESVLQALQPNNPANSGFLRDDSVLAVVFLTDEDDCSAPPDSDLFDPSKTEYGALLSYRCTRYGIECGYPPAAPPYDSSGGPLSGCVPAPSPPGKLYDVTRYLDFFRNPSSAGGVRANPSDVLLFSIAAPPSPFEVILANPSPQPPGPYIPCAGPIDGKSCAVVLQHSCVSSTTPSLFGDPAVRISAVVGGGMIQNSVGDICNDSYVSVMQALGDAIVSFQTGNGCLPGPPPDPNDPRCIVDDLVPNGPGVDDQRVPSCLSTDGATPCWRLQNFAACSAPDPRARDDASRDVHLQLTIDRGGTTPPAGTTSRARCVIVTG